MKPFTVWINGQPHEAYSFGQVSDTDVAGGIAAVIDLVNRAGAALDDAVSRMGVFTLNKDDKRARVDDWHVTANEFVNFSSQLDQYPERVDEWKRLGLKISGTANDLAAYIGDDTLSSAIGEFIVNMPAALDATYKAVLAKASQVATEVVRALEKPAAEAAKGTAKIILIVGGAAALMFFLLRKSGVRGGIGPVRLGGIPSGRRLIRGYGRR